jgi:cytochrome c6
MKMKRIVVLITLGLLATGAIARAADAKETYDKQCAKCHGVDGKGDTKMGKKLEVKDYTDAKVQASMTDDEMAKTIKQGKKEGDKTKMKAFTDLNDSEVKALVAYIRNFKK